MHNPAMLRQAYLLASREVFRIECRMSEIDMERKGLERLLEPAFNVKSALASAACPSCLGQGYIRHVYAQDDIKSEKCETCGGDGLPKERP
jgi:Zn ribbon nucleic-acid-binding protein